MDAAEGRFFLRGPVHDNDDHVGRDCAAFVSRAVAERAVDENAYKTIIAAVVAQYSPLLSAYERKVIAGLFDGNAKAGAKGKLSVSAETVTCRISNVAITERSCQITFKKGKRSLKGREANEVFATFASAGVTAEGAAGSMIESVSKLSCTLTQPRSKTIPAAERTVRSRRISSKARAARARDR